MGLVTFGAFGYGCSCEETNEELARSKAGFDKHEYVGAQTFDIHSGLFSFHLMGSALQHH